MKYLIIALMFLNLSGCAIATIFDNADGCQMSNKPQGYKMPSYCGASGSSTYVTRGYYNNFPVATTRQERW